MNSMGRIAVIDAQVSGISGDMLLSSLVDAGANKKRVTAPIFACQKFLKGSSIQEVNFRRKVFGGFGATQLALRSRDNVSARRGIEMYQALSQCCEHAGCRFERKGICLGVTEKNHCCRIFCAWTGI